MGLKEGNEAFYICADETEGFVIVSADERMPDVLGYSTSGLFDPDNIPSNMHFLLECYASQQEHLSETQYMTPNARASVMDMMWRMATNMNCIPLSKSPRRA